MKPDVGHVSQVLFLLRDFKSVILHDRRKYIWYVSNLMWKCLKSIYYYKQPWFWKYSVFKYIIVHIIVNYKTHVLRRSIWEFWHYLSRSIIMIDLQIVSGLSSSSSFCLDQAGLCRILCQKKLHQAFELPRTKISK